MSGQMCQILTPARITQAYLSKFVGDDKVSTDFIEALDDVSTFPNHSPTLPQSVKELHVEYSAGNLLYTHAINLLG